MRSRLLRLARRCPSPVGGSPDSVGSVNGGCGAGLVTCGRRGGGGGTRSRSRWSSSTGFGGGGGGGSGGGHNTTVILRMTTTTTFGGGGGTSPVPPSLTSPGTGMMEDKDNGLLLPQPQTPRNCKQQNPAVPAFVESVNSGFGKTRPSPTAAIGVLKHWSLDADPSQARRSTVESRRSPRRTTFADVDSTRRHYSRRSEDAMDLDPQSSVGPLAASAK